MSSLLGPSQLPSFPRTDLRHLRSGARPVGESSIEKFEVIIVERYEPAGPYRATYRYANTLRVTPHGAQRPGGTGGRRYGSTVGMLTGRTAVRLPPFTHRRLTLLNGKCMHTALCSYTPLQQDGLSLHTVKRRQFAPARGRALSAHKWSPRRLFASQTASLCTVPPSGSYRPAPSSSPLSSSFTLDAFLSSAPPLDPPRSSSDGVAACQPGSILAEPRTE
jgi:hypothetical protein